MVDGLLRAGGQDPARREGDLCPIFSPSTCPPGRPRNLALPGRRPPPGIPQGIQTQETRTARTSQLLQPRFIDRKGFICQDTAELFFEDLRVPGSALLGQENHGFYYLMDQLPQERVGAPTTHLHALAFNTLNNMDAVKTYCAV